MNTREIIETFGTPLYVYEEDTINQNYRHIHKSIPYPNKQIHFAVMCNNRIEILKIFLELGCGVQVSSLYELELVYNAGFTNSQISFTSTGLDLETIKILSEQNIQINLDSLEELEKLGIIRPSSKVGIRIKMKEGIELPVGHTNSPKNSDIGITISDFEKIKAIALKYNITINGIHGYLASNILVAEPFLEVADYLKEAAKQFPDLEYINFDSGFGVPENPNDIIFDFGRVCEYYSIVTQELSDFFGRSIQMKIEPGRIFMASSGSLYTKVTNVKQVDGKKQIAINAGFAEFVRPKIYNTYCEIEVENKYREIELYDIRANTVLQSDFLAKNRLLPKVQEGDILIIRNTGAYGIVLASGFPGKRLPNEILINRNGEAQQIN